MLVVWSELSRKLIPCDCFVRSKCYTFLESLLTGKQSTHGVQFFFGQWYILQTRMEKYSKSQKSKYLLNYKCYYNETLHNYTPEEDQHFARNFNTTNTGHTNLWTRMKIMFLVCKIVRNYILWLKLCTLKVCHKIQLWWKFEVNWLGGSKVIKWPVNYTWNLSKGSP